MMFGNVRLWVKNLGVRHFMARPSSIRPPISTWARPRGLLAAHVNAAIER